MLSEWAIENNKRLIRVYKKEVEEILEEQTAYLEQVAKLEEDKKKRLEWIRDLEKQLEEAKEHENAVVKIES